MHFAERYKRKIRELETDRERVENRLIEEHAENILLREELCRLQNTVKTLNDTQRSMENENLRLRSELMNEQFKNEKLESDIARKHLPNSTDAIRKKVQNSNKSLQSDQSCGGAFV